MSTPVAFLGLGIMGSRMAANLARADVELTVWNRTAATAQAFAAEHGATATATPAQAAGAAAVVFTMVVDGPQVEAVLLAPDEGAAAGAKPGTLFVDCSTIGPAYAQSIGAALDQRGLKFMDAPVTGSSPKAQDGTLTIMAGGGRAEFDLVEPLLQAMGQLILYAGPLGHGQIIKLINNSVAAINTAAVGQALLVGKGSGVDLDVLTAVMAAGSGGSAMLDLKAAPMRAHDYTTLFKLDHMLKDVRLCLEQAQDAGVPFDLAAATEQILSAASAEGHGDHDFAALINAVEAQAGFRL